MSARNAKLTLHPGGRGTVEVDGRTLPGIRSVHVLATADADATPRLVLDVAVAEVEVDGEMTVTVPVKTREALAALGDTMRRILRDQERRGRR